jgi:TonB family protein
MSDDSRPSRPVSPHRDRIHYERRLAASTLLALLVAGAGFYLCPEFRFSPHRLPEPARGGVEPPFLQLLAPPLPTGDVVAVTEGPAPDVDVDDGAAVAPIPVRAPAPLARALRPTGAPAPMDFEPLPSTRAQALFRMRPVDEMPLDHDLDGVVVIKARVGKQGRVVQAYVVKGISRVLDEQALIAAWQIQLPASKERESRWVTLPYEFELR